MRSARRLTGGIAALMLLILASSAQGRIAPAPCLEARPCPPGAMKLMRAHQRATAPSARAAARVRARARKASGTLLAPCDDPPESLCGSIEVPLDRSQPAGPTTPVFFSVIPHGEPGPLAGTILASAGGPGFSSSAEGFFPFLFGPLLDHRDLLTIDLRGTGRSAPIDCGALQHGEGALLDAIGACGAQLGAAASRFGSADRAEDIEDVRAALGIPKLDYFGLSGGGLQAQAYAVRHGDRLRTLVLDAPYRVGFDDAVQSPSVTALLRGVELICRRSPSCDAADPRPLRTLRGLIARVRRHAVAGTALDADGEAHRVVVDETRLVNLLADPSGGFLDLSEISAAGRALERGDAAPLLRMAAETDFPSFFDAGDPRFFSAGDFYATFCADGSFPWDEWAPEPTRRSQYDAAVTALPRGAFAPFSVGAWERSLVATADICVPWPARTHVEPPIPAGARFPAVPTLVLTGDLDAAVPSESARAVARRFPRAQLVTVANAGHTATQSSGCARGLVVRFVDSAAPVDADCASRFNPTYGVAAFPRDAAHARVPAIDPTGGDRSRRRDRRVAGMAWAAAYDAIQRSFRMFGDHGAGLRGGSFSLGGTDTTLDLSCDGVRFTRDVAVDGTAHIDFETGKVDAVLEVDGPGARDGRLRIAGPLFPHAAPLPARGELGGRHIAIVVPTA
jgi:pimeloyl-ACP methyl ester carboxylesterase